MNKKKFLVIDDFNVRYEFFDTFEEVSQFLEENTCQSFEEYSLEQDGIYVYEVKELEVNVEIVPRKITITYDYKSG